MASGESKEDRSIEINERKKGLEYAIEFGLKIQETKAFFDSAISMLQPDSTVQHSGREKVASSLDLYKLVAEGVRNQVGLLYDGIDQANDFLEYVESALATIEKLAEPYLAETFDEAYESLISRRTESD